MSVYNLTFAFEDLFHFTKWWKVKPRRPTGTSASPQWLQMWKMWKYKCLEMQNEKKQLSTGATSLNWQFLHNGSKYKSFQLTQKYPGSALSNGWVKNLSKKFYTYALMEKENIGNPVACFITSHPLASSRFPYHGQSFPLYTQFVGDRKGIKQLPSYQKLATKDFQSSPMVFHLFAILNFNNKKQVEKGRFFNQKDPVSLVLMRQRRKGREVTTQGRSSLWKWRLIWLRK